jgi:hypothetical protein
MIPNRCARARSSQIQAALHPCIPRALQREMAHLTVTLWNIHNHCALHLCLSKTFFESIVDAHQPRYELQLPSSPLHHGSSENHGLSRSFTSSRGSRALRTSPPHPLKPLPPVIDDPLTPAPAGLVQAGAAPPRAELAPGTAPPLAKLAPAAVVAPDVSNAHGSRNEVQPWSVKALLLRVTGGSTPVAPVCSPACPLACRGSVAMLRYHESPRRWDQIGSTLLPVSHLKRTRLKLVTQAVTQTSSSNPVTITSTVRW